MSSTDNCNTNQNKNRKLMADIVSLFLCKD